MRAFRLLAAAIAAGAVAACGNSPAALTQLLEARRLAAELRLEFTKGAGAANRAVMAETDDGSTAAANEARHARQIVERNVEGLRAILQPLGYQDDVGELDGFWSCFAEYRKLDDEILPLAVENTNVKAQRLSFGPAREAADAFRTAVDSAVQKTAASNAWRARAAAAKAVAAVLEIRVMQSPHIAEAEDTAMTGLEDQMDASAEVARRALDELKTTLGPAAGPQIAAARAALDRFMAIHREIITLSRRNSDVRSLALSLGRKRVVTAACEDRLRTLEDALAKHEFTATR